MRFGLAPLAEYRNCHLERLWLLISLPRGRNRKLQARSTTIRRQQSKRRQRKHSQIRFAIVSKAIESSRSGIRMPGSRAASLGSRFNPLITRCIQIMTRRRFVAGFIFREAERLDECMMGHRKDRMYGKHMRNVHTDKHKKGTVRESQNHTRNVDHTGNTQAINTQIKHKKRTHRRQTKNTRPAKHTQIAPTENKMGRHRKKHKHKKRTQRKKKQEMIIRKVLAIFFLTILFRLAIQPSPSVMVDLRERQNIFSDTTNRFRMTIIKQLSALLKRRILLVKWLSK